MYREEIEAQEWEILSPIATKSGNSRGRQRLEPPCEYRTAFQRDRDRILHCKSFRRLMHKTQVFLSPEGDHYTTRLTHSLEVSQIARTIARALRLNEDLTEAIALGHDLGHTPFGHAGERSLNALASFPFLHSEQSLRVVSFLERNGQGLNLSWEVLDGIQNHASKATPNTPEGQVVRLSDKIAYLNHDADDAIRADVLRENEFPMEVLAELGRTKSKRITTLIDSIVEYSQNQVEMDPKIASVFMQFRQFMFSAVYTNPVIKGEEAKAAHVVEALFQFYMAHPEKLPEEFSSQEDTERAVCDHISGMTDRYATAFYEHLFIPKSWQIHFHF